MSDVSQLNPMQGLGTLDLMIFGIYVLIIVAVGLFSSRKNKSSAEGYFLAGKSLPWWVVGASLIAANISAEQFIGMSGSGFVIGLGISSYEIMSALTLVIVAKFFLPIFIEKGIYTIPEFVEKRFNKDLKTILALFWIALFIFVNLASVLYLGGTALEIIMGIPLMYTAVGLALFALIYSVYGGLSSVVWTDVIQVIILVLGGFATTFIAISFIGGDEGFWAGLSNMMAKAPSHFDMILDKSNPQFINLPGIAVIIGGLWVANLYYWGFNQYIIQRTFAAKSLHEAQKGLLFAGFLKILTPIIVVLPGISAFVILGDPELKATISQVFSSSLLSQNLVPTMEHADRAYPWLVNFLPIGLKGLVFAALAAAIVSSLASMLNSTATIFTMDIYKEYFNKKACDKKLVNVGRFSAVVALLIALIITPLLGTLDQAIQYIQEYTGVVSPGILAVFLAGIFYKKTTSRGAIYGVLASIPVALLLKLLPLKMPFMDQMLYTFIISLVVIIFSSICTSENDDDPKAIILTKSTFKTTGGFTIATYAMLIITALIYVAFW